MKSEPKQEKLRWHTPELIDLMQIERVTEIALKTPHVSEVFNTHSSGSQDNVGTFGPTS